MKINPYQHKVLYRENDMMGVVNNGVYIGWMEDSRVDFLNQIGCDYKMMEEKGFASPVMSISIDYKFSACMGDNVEIEVKIKEYSGIKLIVEYEIRNRDSKKVYAVASSKHCFIDLKTKKPLVLKKYFPDWDEKLLAVYSK